MRTCPAVLMLEFNELSPRLMDRFIREGLLPNFRRLRDESFVALTDPEETQDGLEPWIQWVTVHTGVARSEHGLEKLGEAARLDFPTVGQVVAEAGGQVWMCGSMNLPRAAAGGGWFLPDPWNPDARPHPAELSPFADFVRANVQEHSNPTGPSLGFASVFRFLWLLVRRGLSLRTIQIAASQLVNERKGTRGRWARASVLDRFQWDLFRWRWERDPPTFATFFSNSTAHYQHVFWRNLEPEVFDRPPSASEQSQLSHAIQFGYQQMDQLVGEALEMVEREGAILMFCTGLSQQPYVAADERGGKFVYRPHRIEDLVDALGIDSVQDIAPVMAEQFHLFFSDETAARAAVHRFEQTTLDGEPAFSTRVVGHDVFVGCSIHHVVDDGALLTTPSGDVPLTSLLYRSDVPKSGFHHPDGMWWIRTGEHRTASGKVPLRAIAPTILQTLAIEPPPTMTATPIGAEMLAT